MLHATCYMLHATSDSTSTSTSTILVVVEISMAAKMLSKLYIILSPPWANHDGGYFSTKLRSSK